MTLLYFGNFYKKCVLEIFTDFCKVVVLRILLILIIPGKIIINLYFLDQKEYFFKHFKLFYINMYHHVI